jgi:hypothetical protein
MKTNTFEVQVIVAGSQRHISAKFRALTLYDAGKYFDLFTPKQCSSPRRTPCAQKPYPGPAASTRADLASAS